MESLVDYLGFSRENEFPITLSESKSSPHDLLKLSVVEPNPLDQHLSYKPLPPPIITKPIPDDLLKKMHDKMHLNSILEPVYLSTTQEVLENVPGIQAEQFPKEDELKIRDFVTDTTFRATWNFPDQKVVVSPPHVTISFSQPIYFDDSAIIEIRPEVKGVMRLVGTNTLLFEPTSPFPCATEFQVSLPMGLNSIYGKRLGERFSYSFSTPPPKLVDFLPGSITVTEVPLFYLQFDQEIDPERVFEFIKLVDGSLLSLRWSSYPLKLLDVEQVKTFLASKFKKDKMKLHEQNLFHAYEKRLQEGVFGRFIWCTVENPLALDCRYYLQVLPGLPSAEGRIVTSVEQGFKFKTYSPLIIESNEPSSMPCLACQPWTVRFSNPLMEIFDDQDLVRIDPPLEGMKITQRGPYLNINGRSVGSTSYTVTFTQRLQDVFGQRYLENKIVTIEVGESPQLLTTFQPGLIVHDSSRGDKPIFTVVTCNIAKLRVLLFQVDPEKDFDKCPLGPNGFSSPIDLDPLSYTQVGKLILDTVVMTDAYEDSLTEVDVDLYDVLEHKKELLGHILIYVEPNKSSWKGNWRFRPRIVSWVQCTRLAADFFTNQGFIYVWANSLKDGSPIKDAEVIMNDQKSKVNENGLVVFQSDKEVPLIVKSGIDSVFLNFQGRKRLEKSNSELYIVADKSVYRPNDHAIFRGIIRLIEHTEFTCKVSPPEKGLELKYSLRDYKGIVSSNGKTTLGEFGSFEIKIQLPSTINFDMASLILECKYWTKIHKFDVQNLSRDQVKFTTHVNNKEFLVNGTATISAIMKSKAQNLSCPISWTLKQERGVFSPPGWSEYIFQKSSPQYWDFQEKLEIQDKQIVKGMTNSSGEHRLYIDFKKANVKENIPVIVQVEATVTDEIYGKSISSSNSFIVHPSKYYIGLKAHRSFSIQNQKFMFEAVVTDHSGKLISDVPIAISLKKQIFKGDLPSQESFVEGFIIQSLDRPITTSFTIERGGFYTIYAVVQDEKSGLANTTAIHVCHQGKTEIESPLVQKNQVVLIPDKGVYKPGDKAELFIQVPFAGPSDIFIVLSGESILSRQFFKLASSTQVIKLAIEKDHVPNIFVDVYAVGKTSLGVEKTAYAAKKLLLTVSPTTDQKIEISTSKFLTSGILDVDVSCESDGEVSLLVVDENFVHQTGFRIQTPHSLFYQKRRENLLDSSTRGRIVIKDWTKIVSQLLVRTRDAPATSDEEDLPDFSTIRLKPEKSDDLQYEIDVKSLSDYYSSLTTQQTKGKKTSFKIPLREGTYRIWAVYHSSNTFGLSEILVAPTSKVSVKPMIPKSLVVGDETDLVFLMENLDDKDHELSLAIKFRNLKSDSPLGLGFVAKKGDKCVVNVPFRPVLVGDAELKIIIQTSTQETLFELTCTINVDDFAPETYSLCGVLRDSVVQRSISIPKDVSAGELTISIAKKESDQLIPMYQSFHHDSCETVEMIASQIIGCVSLDPKKAHVTVEELRARVEDLLQRILSSQKLNGGWGNYNRNITHPYISLHSIFALSCAKVAGFPIAEKFLRKAKNYINNLDVEFKQHWKMLSDTTKNSLRAFGIFLLSRFGEHQEVNGKVDKLLNDSGMNDPYARKITHEGVAWLILALYEVGNKSSERISSLTLRLKDVDMQSYDDEVVAELYQSPARTYSILLLALLNIGEQSQVNKLAELILAERNGLKWVNSQDAAYAMYSLGLYFEKFESYDSKSVAKAWVGTKQIETTKDTQIPFKSFSEILKNDNRITLRKNGEDPIWYSIQLTLSPVMGPLEQGISISRSYSYLNQRNPVLIDEQDAPHILIDELIRVTITVSNGEQKHHVSISDHIPAGFLFLYPEAKPIGAIPHFTQKVDKHWYTRQSWFESMVVSDGKIQISTSCLWIGSHHFSYVVRPVLQGTYHVQSASARELYSSNVFGRSRPSKMFISTSEKLKNVVVKKPLTIKFPFKDIQGPKSSPSKPRVVFEESIHDVKKTEVLRPIKAVGFKPVDMKNNDHVRPKILVSIVPRESHPIELTPEEQSRLQKLEQEKKDKEDAQKKKFDEYRKKEMDAQKIKEEEDKKKWVEIEGQRAIEDAVQRKAFEESEKKRLVEEAEKKKIQDEAEKQQISLEIEQKRIAKEAEVKRLAVESEKIRLAKEIEDKKALQDRNQQEQERIAKLTEENRIADELEKKRISLESEQQKSQLLAAENEKKRLEEEKRIADLEMKRQAAEEVKRLAEETEKKRLAEIEEKRLAEKKLEEEKKRIAEEAEIARIEEEKRIAAETEKKRIAAEVDRRRKDAAEKIKREQEEKKKREDAEEERKRIDREKLMEELRIAEEKQKQAEIDERNRLEKIAREEEEEAARLEAEIKETERLAVEAQQKQELERIRIAEEAQMKYLEEQRILAENLEKKRITDEIEAKGIADELESKRIAEVKMHLEEERIVAQNLEKKRIADEIEAKRVADELESKRIAEEKLQKDEEAAKKLLFEESETKRLSEEAERKRKEEETKNSNPPTSDGYDDEYDVPEPFVVKKVDSVPVMETPKAVEDGYSDDEKIVPEVNVEPKKQDDDDGYGDEPVIIVPKKVDVVQNTAIPKGDGYSDEEGYGDEPEKVEPKKEDEDDFKKEEVKKDEGGGKKLTRFASMKLNKGEQPVIKNDSPTPKSLEKKGSFLQSKIVKKEEAKKEEPKGDGYEDEYDTPEVLTPTVTPTPKTIEKKGSFLKSKLVKKEEPKKEEMKKDEEGDGYEDDYE